MRRTTPSPRHRRAKATVASADGGHDTSGDDTSDAPDELAAAACEGQGSGVVAGAAPASLSAPSVHAASGLAELIALAVKFEHDFLQDGRGGQVTAGVHVGRASVGVVGDDSPRLCLLGEVCATARSIAYHTMSGGVFASQSFVQAIFLCDSEVVFQETVVAGGGRGGSNVAVGGEGLCRAYLKQQGE